MKILQPNFSHIYLEKDAKSYALTDLAISQFPKAKIIEIEHYKDVFNRPRQDFQFQKQSMKMILAKKRPPFLYPASDIIQDYGTPNVYYNTPILNCIYNCDYCFLQGMYPSGNLVVFVNENDFHQSIINQQKNLPAPNDPMIISISYNTDILAMENLFPMASLWIDFVKKHENVKIEIRTKSALFTSLKHQKPSNQVILSWSISPEEVCQKYETTAAPLSARLRAIQKAISAGWKVRLCLDPILLGPHWETQYSNLIQQLFSTVDTQGILDITLGVFRMSKDYFNLIRKREPKSDLYYQNYVIEDNIITIPESQRKEAIQSIRSSLLKFVKDDQILVWG